MAPEGANSALLPIFVSMYVLPKLQLASVALALSIGSTVIPCLSNNYVLCQMLAKLELLYETAVVEKVYITVINRYKDVYFCVVCYMEKTEARSVFNKSVSDINNN